MNDTDNSKIINLKSTFNNMIKVGNLIRVKLNAIDDRPINVLYYGIVYEVTLFDITIIPADKVDSKGNLEKLVISAEDVYLNRIDINIIHKGDFVL